MRRRAILLTLATVLLAACDIPALLGPVGGAYPGACEELGFGARRCEAIVDRAVREAGIKPDATGPIDILPRSTNGTVTLGGQMIARVRFHPSVGPVLTQEVWCTGVYGDGDLACNPDPRIRVIGGVDHDVPCPGEAPEGCATPPPTPRPSSVAAAVPLRLATLDIPIDHLGHYDIEIGKAGLPDGVLSARSAALADPKPETFWITDGVGIDVRPVDPTRTPVGSVYRDPFDGVEPVTVFLVFEVTGLSPGGVLRVRDVVVG